MPAPSIGMISNSLKSCSLNGRGGGRGVFSPAVSSPLPERRVEVAVELHSEDALPYHWEQCLDMRTGEVYFRNWTTGKITSEDPRISELSSSISSSDDDSSDEDSSNEGSIDNYFIGDLTSDNSSSSSTTSAYFQEVTSAHKSPKVTSSDNQVLVAAGCKSCFMYFMVPKKDSACPKCGHLLLHLGRH